MVGILRSFKNAFNGLILAFPNHINMRIHVFIACICIILGLVLKLEPIEWAGIFICFGLVFSLELINTAIEELTNFISPDFHPQAGKVKDLAAAAVLVGSFFAFLVGLFIFIPKIYYWGCYFLYAR